MSKPRNDRSRSQGAKIRQTPKKKNTVTIMGKTYAVDQITENGEKNE